MLISNTIKVTHRPRPARAPSARGLHRDVVPERAHDRRGGHLPRGGAGARRSAARRGPAQRSRASPSRSASPSGAPGCSSACIGSPTRWPGSRSAGRGSACARWRSGAGSCASERPRRSRSRHLPTGHRLAGASPQSSSSAHRRPRSSHDERLPPPPHDPVLDEHDDGGHDEHHQGRRRGVAVPEVLEGVPVDEQRQVRRGVRGRTPTATTRCTETRSLTRSSWTPNDKSTWPKQSDAAHCGRSVRCVIGAWNPSPSGVGVREATPISTTSSHVRRGARTICPISSCPARAATSRREHERPSNGLTRWIGRTRWRLPGQERSLC